MILCDKDIKARLKDGNILLEPFNDEQVSSSSIDLRLGDQFRVFKHTGRTHIDPYDRECSDDYTELHKITDKKPFTIHPGEFVLASTHERIEMPSDLVGSIDGRSSLGRLGIIIQTAAMVDAGFKGHITLELANIGKMPVNIYPGMRICRMTFQQLTNECEMPYNGKYLDQQPAEGSKIEQDSEFK
ncbi:MAG: dCTP deaminase [Candidatus Nanoarchaeia archaeon]|jgi:dCTP deaminase